MKVRRATEGQLNCVSFNLHPQVNLRHSISPQVSQESQQQTTVKDNSVQLIILTRFYAGFLITNFLVIVPLEIWSSYLMTIDIEVHSFAFYLIIFLSLALQILQIIAILIGSIGLHKRKLSLLGKHLIVSLLVNFSSVSCLAIAAIWWMQVPFASFIVTSFIKCTAVVILIVIQREIANQASHSSRFYISSAAIY